MEDAPDPVNRGPAAGAAAGNTPEFSVSELSGAVKRMVEGEFGHVRVRGEIGRVSRPRSGHIYMDLKDERSVLAGVVWKGQAARLAVQPEEGAEVIATGRLTTFPGQSKYQIVIESLAWAGEGALLARLERLKAALAKEGLFAEERKRPLPWLPRVVGVVTSPSGAVIRDILHRLSERFPMQVLLWPVAVQGEKCAPEVAAAIRGFSALPEDGPVPRPDVVIVARGGGSVEDLWGFNEEAVVRAAAASSIPLISAVGHETDTTLIDFAADRRAPTPTAAAEMAVPVRADLIATVGDLEGRRIRALARRMELVRQRLHDLARALPRPQMLLEGPQQRLDAALARLPRPERLTAEQRARLALAAQRLPGGLRQAVAAGRGDFRAVTARLVPMRLTDRILRASERLSAPAVRLTPAAEALLARRRDGLTGLARTLRTLGPKAVLARGFAIVRAPDGTVISRAAAVTGPAALELEFDDGRIAVTHGPAAPEPPKPARRPRKPNATPEGQTSLFGPDNEPTG
ncbi:MAG: exodeoxyribonuclease VII large subunit [Pseudomonadota bacterium]